MTKLCIKKFGEGNEKPLTTVSIPIAVIKMVKSLIPKKLKKNCKKKGLIFKKSLNFLSLLTLQELF